MTIEFINDLIKRLGAKDGLFLLMTNPDPENIIGTEVKTPFGICPIINHESAEKIYFWATRAQIHQTYDLLMSQPAERKLS